MYSVKNAYRETGPVVCRRFQGFDTARETVVRDAIVKKYGKYISTDDTGSLWHIVGPSDAVRIEKRDVETDGVNFALCRSLLL